jgi:hypothetical protein
MCDLFALNYAGPTYSTIKHRNKKRVHFGPGKHGSIFQAMAAIYLSAMEVHNIVGTVLVILTEDETKVKQRIAWEPKIDTLVGFCGPKNNHVCISDYKPVVGETEDRYNKINIASVKSARAMSTWLFHILFN